jgi:thiamine-phosphate pyrophosphorylase
MTINQNPLLRVIDANLNRYREGIRVVEDIFRYTLNDKELSSKLKSLRHIRVDISLEKLLDNRDSINDVLKPSTNSEKNRNEIKDIIIANFKRAQESSRVLEEILKINDIKSSEEFKNARYQLYNLEKLAFQNYNFKF